MPRIGGVGNEQLRAFVGQIESAEDEKAQASDHVRAIYANAKAAGFNVKVLRQVIKRRKLNAQERGEFDQLLDLYEAAVDEQFSMEFEPEGED